MQKKVISLGLAKFNQASSKLKAQTTGRVKRWNKEFNCQTVADLQQVFDTDMIIVLEGMGFFDSNETDRLLDVDFQYRNHSAHPGEAPIEEPQLIAFFSDVSKIILNNPKFKLS